MVDEHGGVVAVTGDVLDVDVVFDAVDALVAHEVTAEVVQQFLELVLREGAVAVLGDGRAGSGGGPGRVADGLFGRVNPALVGPAYVVSLAALVVTEQ